MSQPLSTMALVVVTHDSAAWLPEFAASWRACASAATLLHQQPCEIILADSGSTDATLETARRIMPEAMIVECGDIGFGAAANRGIAETQTTWVLLCNPDLVFPETFARTLIDPVLAGESSHQGDCIAPRLVNPDGTPQASIGAFPTIGSVLRDQFRPREMRKYVRPQPAESQLVNWATGACLLLNRAAFTAVGGFDEQFFLYVEEVDLQRRLSAQGLRTWFAAETEVIHHAPNAARSPRENVQRWSARGMLRYFARHGSTVDLVGYKTMALLSGRLGLREVLRGRSQILSRSTR